ncbi:MAG: peptidoglycan DD-metalloendopeptidase family protein [Actinobacteria bacterium]|nr:peptidoglycan DD-metalloendopeptidase family protein [Actinomycetota bacterium]
MAFILLLNPALNQAHTDEDASFELPVEGDMITDYMQKYWLDINESNFHCGIDIEAEEGTSIKSAGDGVVSFVGWTPAGEKTVAVVHKNGIRTTYLNFAKVFVVVGQHVLRGQTLGIIGESKDPSSEVNHLHFGAIYHGHYIDPKLLFMLDINDITGLINLTEELDTGKDVSQGQLSQHSFGSQVFGFADSEIFDKSTFVNYLREEYPKLTQAYHWYWDGDVLSVESKEERTSYFDDKKIVFVSGLGSSSDESSIIKLKDKMAEQFGLEEDQMFLFSYDYPNAEFKSHNTTKDLNESAYNLKDYLEDIRKQTGMQEDEKFIIIAHSQGGQVIRQYMINNTESAEKELDIFFSLASPNHGAIGATYAQKYHELGPGGEILFKAFFKATSSLTKGKWLDFGPFDPSILQMSENSDLNRQGGFDVSEIDVDTVSISGTIDPVIVYPSAVIDGATNYAVSGGHLGACFSDESVDIIEREVRGIEPVNIRNKQLLPAIAQVIGENFIAPAERTFFEFIYYILLK